jgi:hypothetical protein
MDGLRARFEKAERVAVQQPADVNGEILFAPGDIDDRYAHYVGRADDPGNAVVNNLIADILDALGTHNDIWGVRDADLGRVGQVVLDHARAVFRPVEEESVLDKFFAKYGADTDRTIQTLRRVTALSQPFLHLQENAPNYAHNINKEQTIVGVLHGATPRTDSERRFQTMIMESVSGIKDQQISNSNEPHQVLFLRERAAFPLRLLQGMESYRYAYDQVKALGAAANPIHTRLDVKEWVRIAPPSAEDQKAAWRAFVVGWASGVIAEEHEARYTSVGTRDTVRFTAHYVDKFGMPKSDALGGFNAVESPIAGYKPEAANPDRPPLEARDVVQRLCDDRRMQAQIALAIDERLRRDGPRLLGDRLVQHATAQKPLLAPAFYDSYYRVLTDYLEEINYGGVDAVPPAQSAPSAPNAGGAGGVVPALMPPTSAAPAVSGNGGAGRSLKDRLASLKELRDEEIISQEEFDARRREILAEV